MTRGCGALRGVPAEGVGKDLPLKNVGKKSMDPVAALQDDAGPGRRCPLKAALTWWGKALPRGRLPPLFNFEGGFSAGGCDGEGHGLFAQGAGDGEAVGGVRDGKFAVAEDGVFAAHLDHITDKFV